MSTTTEQASRSRRRAAKSIALTLGMVLLAALAAAPRAQAQTYNVLYNFTNGTDGGVPNGSLIQDKAGSFYGTTYQGAGSGCGGSGCGTVFKLTKTGTLTTLYTFTGGSDGGNPQAGVILSGNTLYGTTTYGGNLNCNIYNGSGCGVVFKLNIETGAETVLYSFTGGADGGVPWYAGLVRDDAGNLYGTTAFGGGGFAICPIGCGVVYKVDPDEKTETVLHTFAGSDGAHPDWSLTVDATGNVLYGTTIVGGSTSGTGCADAGCGVAFSLRIKTDEYKVLYNFTGGTDGGYPGLLSIGKAGVLYGTTFASSGCGTCGVVFEVVPETGKETMLYTFTGGADGGVPWAGVVLDKEGNLYGTTAIGGSGQGSSGNGVVFKLDPKTGMETVLHTFDYTDGSFPFENLFLDARGTLYGTTSGGGTDGTGCGGYGCGNAFSLHPY